MLQGFTLIELLVVIAILGILSAGVLTAINITGNINKANLAKAKTFSASVENALSINQVGKWSFEDVDVYNKTPDTSGYGNSGTLNGGVTSQNKDQCNLGFGGCLKFDGVNGYISIANDKFDSLYAAGNGQITVEYWIKTGENRTNQLIMPISIEGAWFFRVNRNSNNKVGVSFTGSSANLIFSSTNINDDKWHHVVGIYNNGKAYLYVDGALEKSDSQTLYDITIFSNPTFIGTNINLVENYLQGSLDEVAIYNQALTSYQIQHLYAQGLSNHHLVRK